MDPKTPKAQLALSAELRNVIHERNILTNRTKSKFLSALNEIHASDMEAKRENRKHLAVQEVLYTEATYLKHLENIMIFFMKPIREKGIIRDDEFEILFGTIKSIYKVNGELLNLLKEDLTNVALAFTKLAPFFKMYSVYAYDFNKNLQMLEYLLKHNKDFNKLIANQESRPEVQARLSSLLITPIQRIPRYCLLLKQVLDNTLPTDNDYNSLKDSLEKLEVVARHLNTLIEERENSQQILELQRCLSNSSKHFVVQPGRKLIQRGDLNRIFPNNKREVVHVILFSDVLMICKRRIKHISRSTHLKCDHIYPLNRCKIKQNENTKIFEIHCHNEIAVLYHDSGVETDEWITAIKESIEKFIKNRSTLRKESSSRRPADKSNLKPYLDVGISPGIARIKKRRRSEPNEQTEEDNVTESKSKLLKVDAKRVSKIFTGKPKENKATISSTIVSAEAEKQETTDSLFPLRQHFLQENKENSLQVYNPNVFVFGRNNANRGFGFKLVNVLSSIGNKFKKIFGMK